MIRKTFMFLVAFIRLLRRFCLCVSARRQVTPRNDVIASKRSERSNLILLCLFCAFVSLWLIFISSHAFAQQPLSLQDAINMALKQNPMLAAAREDVNLSLAKKKQAKAMLLPSLSFTGYATGGNNPNIFTSPAGIMPQNFAAVPQDKFFMGNFTLMLPLYTGGRLQAMVKQQDAALKISEKNLSAAELDIILMVKESYRMALLAKELVKASDERVSRTEEQYRIDKIAYDVGKIPQYYLFRDEAELADAKQMLANMKKEYDVALIELKTALAMDVNAPLELTDALAYEDITETLDGLTTEAVTLRPEIISAFLMIKQSEQDVTMAKSTFKPQVSLGVMSDTMRMTEMDENISRSRYTAGLVVGIPLFDFGSRAQKKQEAFAMKKKSLAEYESMKLKITSEVNKAWLSLQTAKQNITTAEDALKSAQEEYKIMKLRYEAGKGIQVEVLDASVALLRAQTNHAQALYDYLTAKDKLMRAAGRQ